MLETIVVAIYGAVPGEIGGNRILLDGPSAGGCSTSAPALKRGLGRQTGKIFSRKDQPAEACSQCRTS